jgi:aminoglycoside phosphotransferase (APT) family kinase protein
VLTAVADLTIRVQQALSALHPGEPVGELRTLVGGHSGLTYGVEVGQSGYVVKAVPAGRRAVGRNDVLRQTVALQALAGRGVPVPAVVAASEEPPAWFAMTMAPGESIEPVLDDGEVPPELVGPRMLGLAAAMRAMHDLDPAELGLPTDEILSPSGELARWTTTLRAVPLELRPLGDELVALLESAVPEPVRPALVHGDCRLGNSLFVGADLQAIIDWEIWALGDPRIDLAWFLLFSDPSNFPGISKAAGGLPTEQELIDGYRRDNPDPADMRWFRALARMKMAAIMGHNVKRHREGTHVDPVQETLPPTVEAMLASGVELLM